MLDKFFRPKTTSKETPATSKEAIAITRMSPIDAVQQTIDVIAVERAVHAYSDFLKIRSFDGGVTHDKEFLDQKVAAIYQALEQEGIVLEETKLYGNDNTLLSFVSAYEKALISESIDESALAA